tara:strand:- start:493 stop:921 length:429 start_codon:yes stop_codon:yes gene_type:complete
MITSKIKEVVSVSEPYGKFKVLYHKLIMDNEDKIDIGKQKVQQIGWELTYEIQEKGQHEFDKAKAVAPDKFKSNGQTSYSSSVKKDDVQELIVRQSSLKAAVDLCRGNDCSPEEVCATAQIFAEWVMKKEVKSKTKSDDLPF